MTLTVMDVDGDEPSTNNDPNQNVPRELKAVIESETGNDDARIKEKEIAVLKLGTWYSKQGQISELAELLKTIRPFLQVVSKAKAAKLVKDLVDLFLEVDVGSLPVVQLCLECIEWARVEKRTFLRQALESRLVALYYDAKEYNEALTLAWSLVKELKKVDDKELLVEVQLLTSKIYFVLGNFTKSRASLTSARTTANSIYCPPKLQAALDLQSGILHAEDKDYKTGFSYFYEAFENMNIIDSPKAILALKYLLLCKIMLNSPDDVQQLISGKLALKFSGSQLDSIKAVAKACKDRSLSDFQECLQRYPEELSEDPVIKRHLDALYDSLLENNLLKLIEPFSCVEVSHLAGLISLQAGLVERKLSQMILDKRLSGVLDQGDGVLIIYENTPSDHTLDNVLQVISSMGKVVDALFSKTQQLT